MMYTKIKIVSLIFFIKLSLLIQGQSKMLTLGDKAPKINAFVWIKGNKLTNYDRNKIYLIDFGATWCIGCAHAKPRLSALSKKYAGKLEVISLFVKENNNLQKTDTSYVQKVRNYVQKKSKVITYSVGVDDPDQNLNKNWLVALGKMGIPWSVIVDQNGIITWVGSPNDPELETVIKKVLDHSYDLKAAIKELKETTVQKIPFDALKPLLSEGNGGNDDDFIFRSILTTYKHNIQANNFDYIGTYRRIGNPELKEKMSHRIIAIGRPLINLYYLAYNDTVPTWPKIGETSYGKMWPQVFLELKDSTDFMGTWKSKDGRYNYNLIVPKEKASAKLLQECMQNDLKSYFGYEVSIEKRDMPCWKLKATKDAGKKLKTKTPGKPWKCYLSKEEIGNSLGINYTNITPEWICNKLFWANQTEDPFVDATGIDYEIDMNMMVDLSDLNAVNEALKEFGLYLEKGDTKMKVIVIRDSK